eukprot:PhF_6_TR13881/c0_g1_i2/m.22281
MVALARWMCSIKLRLLRKTLPLMEMYSLRYKCLSIFLDSRYLRRRRRRTRTRRTHKDLEGVRASLVPKRLPWPVWRPRSLAAFMRAQRERERISLGLRMMKKSLMRRRTVARELAVLMSCASLGSSHTRRRPHPKMLLANRACNLSETIV